MDAQTLRQFFSHIGRHGAKRTDECPDEHEIAAALNGSVTPTNRAEFDEHVADCDYCITQIGRLVRITSAMGEDGAPEIIRARAKRLVRRHSVSRRAANWAVAAGLLLAVIFTALQFNPRQGGLHSPPDSLPEVRNVNPDAYHPEVLYPDDGAAISARDPVFRWSAIPGSIHYDVRIVSDDGAMIWQDQVEDTTWRLPGDLTLAAGEEYYFRVDAYLTEAKSVSSRHVLFTVEDLD